MFVAEQRAASTADNLNIALDRAELFGLFLEAILFGIEALVFVSTLHLLHGAKHTRTLLSKFTSVVTIFLLNTIYMGSSLRRLLNAFIANADNGWVPDPAGYLADLTSFLYRFQTITLIVQFIMLDVLVTYRCYTMWGRRLVVIIIPSMGILAYLVTGIAAIHSFASFKSETIFSGITMRWVSATFSVTLFTKIACFVAIVAGAWSQPSDGPWHTIYLKGTDQGRAYKVILLGIETGFMALIGTMVLVPLYIAGQNAQSILLHIMSPLTGLSFLLIITAALLGFTPSMSGPSGRYRAGAGHFSHPRFNLPSMTFSRPPQASRFSTTSLFVPPIAFDMEKSISPPSKSRASSWRDSDFPDAKLAHIAPFVFDNDVASIRTLEPVLQSPASSALRRMSETLPAAVDTHIHATTKPKSIVDTPKLDISHLTSSVEACQEELPST